MFGSGIDWVEMDLDETRKPDAGEAQDTSRLRALNCFVSEINMDFSNPRQAATMFSFLDCPVEQYILGHKTAYLNVPE